MLFRSGGQFARPGGKRRGYRGKAAGLVKLERVLIVAQTAVRRIWRSRSLLKKRGLMKIPSEDLAKVRREERALRKRFDFKSEISNAKFQIFALCLCLALSLSLSSCGYHVGGTAALLPPGLKVIAVPALKNDTPRYRIEQRMTEAVVREFIEIGRAHV